MIVNHQFHLITLFVFLTYCSIPIVAIVFNNDPMIHYIMLLIVTYFVCKICKINFSDSHLYGTREGTCEFYFLTCSDDLICCSNYLISCLHNLSSCSNNIIKLLKQLNISSEQFNMSFGQHNILFKQHN